MMIKEETGLSLGHKLTMESRSHLALTGVADVGSFDETGALLETACGRLLIRGRDLHVEQLNLEAGELRLSGTVDSLAYEENRKTQDSFLGRLFR